MSLYNGLSAFPITPADAAGRVDTPALARVLDRLTAGAVDSVGLLGSTGTYAYLTRPERARAVAAARESLAGAVPLIVGVGALRTDEAVALAQDAARAGADGLLLAPMSYTPLTEEEVFQHFLAVARATDLPLCIYNNPGTTHFTFSVALLARLAAVPQIAAVKMPLPANGDIVQDINTLRAAVPVDFTIGYSGDWGCAAACLAGADAWFSVLGGLFPVTTMAMARAALVGDVDTTQRLDQLCAPMWTAFKTFGSLRVVHALAREMGLINTLPPQPILPLEGAALAQCISASGGLT